jgi:uncharacterized membrane protein YidH (DUF202 family)
VFAVVAGIVFVLGLVLLILGAVRYNQSSKNAIERAETMDQNKSTKSNIALIVSGSILLFLIVGLTIAFMFLPGYPLSKYKSFSECAKLS